MKGGETVETILTWAGLITALAAAGTTLWAVLRWAGHITAGERCQLRSDMLRIYYRHREDKTIRQYEFENFVLCYRAYRALGGNSFIEKIYGEVRTWDVVS